MNELSYAECKDITGGEVLSLTLIIAVLSVSILTILVWKIYTSNKGSFQLPGGFKVSWGSII